MLSCKQDLTDCSCSEFVVVFVLSRLTKLILLKPHLKAQMASDLTNVSSEDLNWPLAKLSLESHAHSYLGICNPVRGKLSCVIGFVLLVPWSLLQGRRVIFSLLFWCLEVARPELGYPYNYFCSGLCPVTFQLVPCSLKRHVPQLKSSREGQLSVCSVLAVCTQNHLLGY